MCRCIATYILAHYPSGSYSYMMHFYTDHDQSKSSLPSAVSLAEDNSNQSSPKSMNSVDIASHLINHYIHRASYEATT